MPDTKEDTTGPRGIEPKTASNHVDLIAEHVTEQSEDASEIEKFPTLPQHHKTPPSFQKSKSLTAAELFMGVMNNEEIAAVGERLKTEEPPLSLEEARERRASITQQRKDSINLIRKRTASRVENTGRPALEDFSKTKNGA